MITAPAFVALFAAVALFCRWRGDRAGARMGWIIAGGCVAAWLLVAASPWWPLWLCLLWTSVAAFILTQRPQTVASAGVAVLVELSACSYLLNYFTAISPGSATAMANAFGLAAAVVVGGPHVGALVSRGSFRASRLGVGARRRGVARGGAFGRAGDPVRREEVP